MRSPVFRAKAHGDLEHLCVHHVRDHSQEACGAEQVSGSREGLCPLLKHHPAPSHLPAGLFELGEFLDPMEGTLLGAGAGRLRVVQRMEGSPGQI